MPENLTQVGVGGLLALALIKMVLEFLGKQKTPNAHHANGNGTAGSKSTEYWQIECRKIVAEVLATNVVPILVAHSQSLKNLEREQRKLMDAVVLRRSKEN